MKPDTCTSNAFVISVILVLLINGLAYSVLAQNIEILNGVSGRPDARYSSFPSEFVELNGTAYFKGTDANGYRLWRTDGTAVGTYCVNTSGTDYCYSMEVLGTYKNSIIFEQHIRSLGVELFISDGTDSGTRLLKDINPGKNSSNSTNLFEVNGRAYFTTTNSQFGRELWVSDGTPSGTKAYDLTPGNLGSNPKNFIVFQNALYFTIGRDLYTIEQQDAEPRFVRGLGLYGLANVMNVIELNGYMYFSIYYQNNAEAEIWKSDGTISGTKLFKTFYDHLFEKNSRVYLLNPGNSNANSNLNFIYYDDNTPIELWSTNSDSVNAKPLNRGLGGFPLELNENFFGSIIYRSELYFLGADSSIKEGYALYKITARNDIVRIGIIYDENVNSPQALKEFKVIDDKLYFAGNKSFHNSELWVYDGTTPPRMVKDIYPGNQSSNPQQFFSYKNKVLFSANNAVHGQELWISDGTEAGTTLLKDIYNRSISLIPSLLTKFNDKLVFSGYNGYINLGLYISDGTNEGTKVVYDSVKNYGSVNPIEIVQYKDKILFNGSSLPTGKELWITNGTEAGTDLLKDIQPGSGHGNPRHINTMNGRTYFVSFNPTIDQDIIYVTDGSKGNTRPIFPFWYGYSGTLITDLAVSDYNIYFVMDNDRYGRELFVSDGTKEGTRIIKDLCPGNCPSIPANSEIFVHNGLVYFARRDSEYGYQLWRTDGTKRGTIFLKKLYNSGSYGHSPPFIVGAIHNNVYFASGLSGKNTELWKTDGSYDGTLKVVDVKLKTNKSEFSKGVAINDELYFLGYDVNSFPSLWKTDGTESGTIQITSDVIVSDIAAFNNNIYFAGHTQESGSELWKSDGTTEGTFMVEDLIPGNRGAVPSGFTAVNDKLYFAAENDVFGRSLHYYQDSSFVPTPKLKLQRNENYVIYPNPASSKMTVKLLDGNLKDVNVKITDMLGRVVIEKIESPESFEIDISHFRLGTYLVHVKGYGVSKIVKVGN